MKIPQPQAGEAAFWNAAHKQVTNALIERDPSSFKVAQDSRTAVAWLQSRVDSVDAESFPGLHKFAVMAVGATLRQMTDSDPRVLALYEDWSKAQQVAADALRIAARR